MPPAVFNPNLRWVTVQSDRLTAAIAIIVGTPAFIFARRSRRTLISTTFHLNEIETDSVQKRERLLEGGAPE